MIVKACIFVVGLLLISSAQAACPTPPGGTNCVIGTPSVPTNAALKALTGMTASTYVYRSGYNSTGDGGDALYYWSGSATCTDDGGSCIAPNTGSGRWLLRGIDASGNNPNGSSAVSIKVFGAACDALTDDTIPIRNALAARSTAFIPANSTCRVYMNSNADGIPMHSGYHFYGENTYTSVLQLIVNQTSTFPQFDFAASGKFVNIVVSKLFPPEPYWNKGDYVFNPQDPNPTTGGNGSLTGGATYYFKMTAVDAAGETTPSGFWHQTLQPGTTNTILVYLPFAVIGDGTGFNLYASATAAGPYFKQNTSLLPVDPTGSTPFIFGTAANPFRTSGTQPPATNTTTVSVGDINTAWSHQVQPGTTVQVSGSTAAPGLNTTYTIQRLTLPDHMIVHTTGVAAGTYTDPTHVIAQSGIGTTLFYAYNRDSHGTGGKNHEIQKIELDHFQIYDASTGVPVVLFDISGTYSARLHHLDVIGPVPRSGVVGFRCADSSPFDNTVDGACFFAHLSDITGNFGTGIHLSVDNYPTNVGGPGPNAGDDMFDNWQGGAQIFIDTTTVGSRGENGGGMFLQGYFGGTNEGMNYYAYPGSPTGSHLELFQCEGCTQHGDPFYFQMGGGANLQINNATPLLFSIMPPYTLSGGAITVAGLPGCGGGVNGGSAGEIGFYVVSDAPSATPAPFSAVTTGGGTFTRPVFCDGVGPNWIYY